ncbi:MAG: hypothetical protein MJ170_03570 [Alphaproteobacteria bacterium]|nr:hypothetical protein [Alphaproteobacteria bacterium]
MQKVSYMGDGTTTEFFFNFPFFENSNVVVTINNTAATGYSIIGTPGGLDPDIPYIGGKVVFETAPTSIDCITIARELSLERIVDYQPLSKIDPTTLNQDLNYLMEVIKDRKDELADLTTKYVEIADKESTEIILSRITAIHDEIVDIDAKIRALGDIGTLQQRVTDLTTTVGGHTTSIGALDTTVDGLNTTVDGHTTSINGLDTRTTGMIDYVIESQAPTAENNYTWYRKYKSGWVEQGGKTTSQKVTLPIEMSDTNYNIQLTGICSIDNNNVFLHGFRNITTAGFITQCNVLNDIGNSARANDSEKIWLVRGFCL